MKYLLKVCAAWLIVVLVMFGKNTYDMNQQCKDGTKHYHSLNMKWNCD